MASQKMWVRKRFGDWEAGCQCCGHLIYLGHTWRRAFAVSLKHAQEHGRG